MARTVFITLSGFWQAIYAEWRNGLAAYPFLFDHREGFITTATFVPTALPHWDTQAIIENLADAHAGFLLRFGARIAFPVQGTAGFRFQPSWF